MNEELKEIIEEMQEFLHKGEKLVHKAQQKMGMRDGSYQGMGQRGGQRMGRMGGYQGGQNMGQMGGVYWGQNPMGQSPMHGPMPMGDEPWMDQRYM